MNWYVNRRYSDFLWLREILSTMFPTILLPQLPKKKIGNRRFENDFVEKRIKGLQDFLDEILKNEIIKTAEPLISFLSLTERGFFEQQMKLLTPKILNIDNIGSIASFEGKIEVADMEDEQYNNNKNYFNSVETFFNLSAEEIKNIKSTVIYPISHFSFACNYPFCHTYCPFFGSISRIFSAFHFMGQFLHMRNAK